MKKDKRNKPGKKKQPKKSERALGKVMGVESEEAIKYWDRILDILDDSKGD